MLVFDSFKLFRRQNHPAVRLVILEGGTERRRNAFGRTIELLLVITGGAKCHPVAFSAFDEKMKSLLEELSVAASPVETRQMSSLWDGTFSRVPHTHNRQRARSYNT